MPKPRTNRLGMYADIREVADAALQAGGGTYHCETHGQAVHWQQRFYRFRKLYAETYHPEGMSPYDKLVLPRIPEDSSTVTITTRTQVGTFVPAAGGVPVATDTDELFDVASQFAKKLAGEE